MIGRIPASVSISAAIAHLDNWNYYVANQADAVFQNSIQTAMSGSPSNDATTALTTTFQKMGLAVNSSWTASIITVAPGAFSEALAYAKQAGLNLVMNQAYSMVVTSQSVSGGSGNSGGSSNTTCEQYAAYDRITNTLGILASIWALSALVTGPVGGAAAAGFGLTAGVLRFLRPEIPSWCIA